MTIQSENNSYKILGIKLLHFGTSIVLFYVFFLLFRYGKLGNLSSYGFRYNYYAAVLYGIMMFFFNRTYNSYLLGYTYIRSLIFGQILSQFFSVLLTYMAVSFAWSHFRNPLVFLPLLGIDFILDVVWSFLGNGYYFKLHPRKRTLLIYRNKLDKRRFGTIHGKPFARLYNITDEIQYDGTYKELENKLSGYDAIFVTGVNSSCRNGILKYCKEHSIPGFFLPHVGDTIMQEARHVQAFDSPVLYVSRKQLNPEYALIKRSFDIVSSSLALIILSPVLLITALAIKTSDGGPVFYRQTRLTKDEREFKIIKFRSMRVDAEKDGVARLSQGENDDRITPVGRIVRRYRIDELPQLINIFMGDMSVVGPRPERPEIAEQYYKKMPDFKLRLQVKAGLTGYAQVYGKYNTAPYEKLEFDLLYINNMSILTDLQLCFATFAILFLPESTDGVASGQMTAMDNENVEEPTDNEGKHLENRTG